MSVFIIIMIVCSPLIYASDKFEVYMNFQGVGGVLNQIVGQGSQKGAERLYASHIYYDNTLDIAAIDPISGNVDVFTSPVQSEMGAWAMEIGSDGQLYVGTMPNAYLLRIDWKAKSLVNLGRPSTTERYIWQLTTATDGKLYGCTYPNAKLIRFDPVTAKSEDLGRMSETELYARSIVADNNGFVYLGIGSSKSQIVAYEIATGKHKNILAEEDVVTGFSHVYRAENGMIIARVDKRYFQLEGWSVKEIHGSDAPKVKPLLLSDGRAVNYDNGWLKVKGGVPLRINYLGKDLSVFRIGLGPDKKIYGSTVLPLYFFQLNVNTKKNFTLGMLGGGEIYSFLSVDNALIGGMYAGKAPLMIYTPSQDYAPDTNRTGNPWLKHFLNEEDSWRPLAMIEGKDKKVYIGAVPRYGVLGGALTILDLKLGDVQQIKNLIREHSIVSLVQLPNGHILGGTSIWGGEGAVPTQKEAVLFVYNPKTSHIIMTTPIFGSKRVDALTLGADGLVYGFAGDTFFVFDPVSNKIIKKLTHSLGGIIYNSMALDSKKRIFGVSKTGVFRVDTKLQKPIMLAIYFPGITGGFAIIENRLFFTSKSRVVAYHLP